MTRGTVNHIGIATSSLDGSEELWSKLGFSNSVDKVNEEQGVRIRYLHGTGAVSYTHLTLPTIYSV